MDILCTLVPSAVVRRRLIFVSAALPKEYPLYWETVVKFATGDNPDVLEESFKRKLQIALQNLRTIYPAAFISDRELAEELVHMQKRDRSGELGVVSISDKSSCFQCGNSLRLRSDRPSQVTIYSESVGTTVGMHYHKLCKNPKCKVVQHYGYVTSGLKSDAQYDDNWADLPYFVSSQETVFETEFLKKMDSELLIGQLSYNQKADIYNHYQCYDSFKKRNTKLDSKKKSTIFQSDEVLLTSETCKSNRTPLDRRRLENAHLRFAVLRIQRSFPEVFSDTTIKPDIHYTLKEINPKLCLAFKQRYSAHRCLYPGRGHVLVIDGNMKNHRDICFAKNSGHIEFMNLPGQIKTGCINTPAYKSRYCADHTSLSGASNEQPLKVITAKKTTRAGIYYQVLCVGPNDKVTWEPESNVTKEMVEDYKRHEDDNEDDNKEADDQSKDHSAKRRRTDTEDETVMTQGKLMDNDMKEDKLKCNTEKDKNMRLNHRTAGVLATMWPCGIITSLMNCIVLSQLGLYMDTCMTCTIHSLMSAPL